LNVRVIAVKIVRRMFGEFPDRAVLLDVPQYERRTVERLVARSDVCLPGGPPLGGVVGEAASAATDPPALARLASLARVGTPVVVRAR